MTIQEAMQELTGRLESLYDKSESSSITNILLEHITGLSRTQRIIQKDKSLTGEQEKQLDGSVTRLLKYEPVQYVLQEAWFAGLKYFVNENVLIPRPETEELIDWIISDCKFPIRELSILDIGTGSGCIPVSLKRKFRKANVYACDVSDAALKIAQLNAERLQADIRFFRVDFLNRSSWESLPEVTLIVSNPPYIPLKDKDSMQDNVVQYEPHIALFVPDNDSLIFYNAIADFATIKLKPGGNIYMEIHENLSTGVARLFESAGFVTEIRKDMQGKDRMIKAFKKEKG
ncbi:MAG: peptide chain release factor N(5)-glutamine methyltransferase [Bacteroidetes bacterium]|nr:peptide chain release factor N(5)-glutamine methyltransferase [Bacteroidota bacterium]